MSILTLSNAFLCSIISAFDIVSDANKFEMINSCFLAFFLPILNTHTHYTYVLHSIIHDNYGENQVKNQKSATSIQNDKKKY